MYLDEKKQFSWKNIKKKKKVDRKIITNNRKTAKTKKRLKTMICPF